MTISDLDLESGLRDQRARADLVAPAPADLAQRTRERYRAQRRTRTALAAGGLLLLLIFVGLPIATSTLADPRGGQTATPHTFTPAAPTGLYALPTRGDLADDDEWLHAVTALDWGPVDRASLPAGLEVPDPPIGSRRVAFAGDVDSGRVALVLGMEGRYLAFAWFVGPQGAEPDEMVLATTPTNVGARDFVGLVDAPSPAAVTQTLVVVALPGDTMMWRGGSTVSASGEVNEESIPLDLDDGIGTHEVSVPWSWHVEVRTPGDQPRDGAMIESDRSKTRASHDDAGIADPRGLAGATAPDDAEMIANSVLSEYSLGVGQAEPTLLAAGPLGAYGLYGELYGLTHPSGAIEVWVTTYAPSRPASGSTISRFRPAPVGQALMDRTIAASAMGGLLVSTPNGTRAQVLDPSGAVLTTIPLTRGAGIGPMIDPSAAKVQILDDAGDVIAEGPITRADR